MMVWTDERIPIWVPPVPGEALDSWLEAYAYRLRTVTVDFVAFLGLRGSSPQKMVRRLTDHERDVLARRTGLNAEKLTTMTLEPYNESILRIHPVSRKMLHPAAWRHYSTTSRYCPGCLAENEGRWGFRGGCPGHLPAHATNCSCSTVAHAANATRPWPASAATSSCRSHRTAAPG